MFAMLRNSLFGLLIVSAVAALLCAIFLAASFFGLSAPRSAWAAGWLPVQVESAADSAPRRRVTRYPSLERAVAKAGSGDTVTVLDSLVVREPIRVDKDLSVVIAQGCEITSSVGKGQALFAIDPACAEFNVLAENASRLSFAANAGSFICVEPAPSPSVVLPANIAVCGANIHDAQLAPGESLISVGDRLCSTRLQDSDVFNLRAPLLSACSHSSLAVSVASCRIERVRAGVAFDLTHAPLSRLVLDDTVLIGSLGCDLIRLPAAAGLLGILPAAAPNLLVSNNSYLSALSAQPVVWAADEPSNAVSSPVRVVA